MTTANSSRRSRRTPADIYLEIQVTIPADLDDRVLRVIRQHQGKDNRVTRAQLVEAVFGVAEGDVELSKSTWDRQIREAITTLQARYPIISSSGDGGYWWPETMDEVNAYAREINSRAQALFEKSANVLRSARELFEEPPQMRLPGV